MAESEEVEDDRTRLPVESLHQGSFKRAWSDLRRATDHWWRFRIPAGMLTAGFAIWGAFLPAKASAAERVASALGGSIGGAVLVGAAAFLALLASAPVRQRNELRVAMTQLKHTSEAKADEPVVAINREIAEGERLLARAGDPTWPQFQRDHAVNEWSLRARGVIRDLAPRYYYWYSDLAPQYRIGPSVGPPQPPQTRLRLQLSGQVERLRDIRDRLLAQRPEGHPDGVKRTTYLRLADILMDAREALSRLMQDGDLDGLRTWDSRYRQLCEEAFEEHEVTYLFENGFRAEHWGAQGNVDERTMKQYMERSIRLGEFVHSVQQQPLNPGFAVERWRSVF